LVHSWGQRHCRQGRGVRDLAAPGWEREGSLSVAELLLKVGQRAIRVVTCQRCPLGQVKAGLSRQPAERCHERSRAVRKRAGERSATEVGESRTRARVVVPRIVKRQEWNGCSGSGGGLPGVRGRQRETFTWLCAPGAGLTAGRRRRSGELISGSPGLEEPAHRAAHVDLSSGPARYHSRRWSTASSRKDSARVVPLRAAGGRVGRVASERRPIRWRTVWSSDGTVTNGV